MRQVILIFSVALVAVAILVLPAFSTRIETVVYDDGKGNMSVVVGGTGPKVIGVMPQAMVANRLKFQHRSRASAEETLLAVPEGVLVEYQAAAETPFEDGYVSAEFGAELWTGTTGGTRIETVIYDDGKGTMSVGVGGTGPKIIGVMPQAILANLQKFHHLQEFDHRSRATAEETLLAIPGSVVGTPAEQFVRYTAGDLYEYWHNNYGIEALTAYYISAMRETASGSHLRAGV